MENITIYKTLNNCLGGSIDYSKNDTVFTTSVEGNQLACLYVKNTGITSKKVLKINAEGIDDISVGTKIINNEIIKNVEESILTTGLPPSVSFTNILHPNLILEPNSFMIVWLLKNNSVASIKKERNTCLNIDWVDL